MFCGHVATLTHEKRENLRPVIHKNIIVKIAFTCRLVKISYRKNFRVYGIRMSVAYVNVHVSRRLKEELS